MGIFYERKKIGQILLKKGIITKEQIEKGLAVSKEKGKERFGQVLLDLGFITERQLGEVMAEHLQIPLVEFSQVVKMVSDAGDGFSSLATLVPEAEARQHQVFPLFKNDNEKTFGLAMVDPLQIFTLDEVQQRTGCKVRPFVISRSDFLKAINRYYSMTTTIEETIRRVERDEEGLGESEGKDGQILDLKKLAEDPPVVRLVNMVIMQAIREKASDIHFEPDREILRIRYRVDGLMRMVFSPPRSMHPGVTSLIKIMSNLDIAVKRTPQDGRIGLDIEGREVDARVATIPTIYGEKIVMRLLYKRSILSLDQLGLSPETRAKFQALITQSSGCFLVTGPTGSGKTTTLYAALSYINTEEKNIVTIEDPVEYHLRMVNQVPVHPKAGVTFANGLRSILRQDPDVIMVGEIRDQETAAIAIQAALTGHLVLSTLHTTDSVGAIARLIQMGIEPFLIAASLRGILAQRLVRRVCQGCRVPDSIPPALLKELGVADGAGATFMRGAGCEECKGTGYSGRIGIYELLIPDETIRHLIVSRGDPAEIRSWMQKNAVRFLREDGSLKASQGITTIEEVLRVIQDATRYASFSI